MKTSPPIDVGMLTGHRLNSMRISEENEVKKKSKAQPRVLKWLPSLMLTLLFLAGSSWSAMGQTLTSTPAPQGGTVYLCVDGTMVLHLDGSNASATYNFAKSAGGGPAYSEGPIPGNGGRISSSVIDIFDTTTPPLYTLTAVQSPFMIWSINVDVTAKPTPPVLNLSQAEGSVNASSSTNISATLATAGSGGVSGSVDGYEYSINGGATWTTYTLGDPIGTTGYNQPSVKIKAYRAHPDGLGCYAETIYTWNIVSRVHNSGVGSYYNIQDAINNASAGNTILVDAGTYTMTAPINVNKELTIIGQGMSNTILEYSSSWYNINNGEAFTLSSPNTTIQGFHFKIVGKGQGNLIGVYQSGAKILDNKFSGEYVFGEGEVTRAVVISGGGTNLLIDGNIIESLRQPGYLSGGSGNISNNTINNTRGWVIESVGALNIANNIFGTNSSHITILDIAPNIAGLAINNNDLSGAKTDWAIDNRTTMPLDAECNWWGAANAQTIASLISGNVDYVNYLVTNNLSTPDCSGSPVVIDATTPTDELCSTSGTIKVEWRDGSANYTVAWAGPVSGSQAAIADTDYTITGLTAGSYTITVTDAYGSTATATQAVGLNTTAPVITPLTADPLTCATGSIDVTATATGSNLSYAWSGGTPGNAQTNNFTAAGTYTVTVTDGVNGCTATASVTVTYYPITNITKNTHYTTIPSAITAATAGDVIEVCVGTYTDNLTINKAITLRGPNYLIHGNDTRQPEAVLSGGNVSFSGTGPIVFEGFKVENLTGWQPYLLNGGTVVTIQNNLFSKTSNVTNVNCLMIANGSAKRTIQNNKFMSTQNTLNQRWNNSIYINAGPNLDLHIIGNVFQQYRTAIGIDDYAGTIEVDENHFGNSTGTFLSVGGVNPSDGHHAFGKNYFTMPISNFGNCSNCATTFRLDLTKSVVDGIELKNASLDQLFNLQTPMTHQSKSSKPGVFMLKENSLFVHTSTGYTINNAVIHALPGDTIFVNNKEWTEKVTVDKDNLTFYGRRYADPVSGRATPGATNETRMTPTAGNDIAFTTSGTINKLTIKGFSFQGGSGGNSRQGIVPAGVVTDLTVENNLFNTFNSATKESFKPYEGSSNVTFKENRYFNSQKGPHYPNGLSGAIHNNIIPGVSGGTAIRLGGSNNDVQIYHNDLSGAGTGVAVLSGAGADNLGTTLVYENNLTNRTTYFDNQRSVKLNNSCNWFGETDKGDINAKVSGNAAVSTYLGSGTNDGSLGFGPTGTCIYPVNNITQGTGHPTIQDAIDNATAGNTIVVDPGTYAEDITIDKSVILLGPNAGIDACDGTRTAEAILIPALGATGAVIDVVASDITIDGFTIDGDNPSLVTGYPGVGGSLDPDVYSAVTRYAPGNNLVIVNNIVKNTAYSGIELYDYPAGNASAGNVVSNNKIKDLGTYDAGWAPYNNYGIGVLIYNNQYTEITENCMENVRIGVQTGNFSKANPGAAQYQQIKDNVISARRTGIMHNLHYSNASAINIESNQITAVDNVNETKWDGIFFGSLSVPTSGVDNTIDGSALTVKSNKISGYNVWNVRAPITNTNITGGTITGVDYGVFANNFEGYNSDGGDGAHATISDVIITTNTGGIGVYALDSENSTLHANVIVSVSDCTIDGGYQGITLYENEPGTVGGTLTENTIEADWAGINIYNGMVVSATNPLTIEGNDILMTDQVTPDANALPTGGIVLRGISGDAPTIKNNNITGAFGGIGVYGVTTTPVTTIEGGTITNSMQGVVVVNLDPINFTDRAPSNVVLKDIEMNTFAGSHPEWADADFHAGVYATSGGSDASATVNVTTENLNISGTGNHSPASAAYIVADWSGLAGMLNVTINESNIHDNLNRGIYTRGEGANVAVNRSTFTNNGSNPYGVGFNDGYAIAVREGASLTALNNFITNPAIVAGGYDVYALFTDGAGAGTATLTAHDNWLSNNSNPNGKFAFNLGDNGVWDATCNWWGAGICMNDNTLFINTVNNTPHLTDGTDDDAGVAGFQPVAGACAADPLVATATVSNQICGALGSISVTFSGGEAPYDIAWNGGSDTGVSSPYPITNLSAGTYNITVTDKCGGTAEATATLSYLPVHNFTQNTYHATIQAAIDAAASGNVINVCAGTYTEDVLIDKPLTLKGANAGISGSGTRGAESIIKPASSAQTPIRLSGNGTSNNVTIDGFEITGNVSNYGINAGDGTSGLTIINNNIHDIGTGRGSGNVYAIRYPGSAANTSNITISDNYISDVFNTTTALGHGAAIWMGQSTANGTVANVNIERNKIENIFAPTGKAATGIDISLGFGPTATGKVSNLLIKDNEINNLNSAGYAAYGVQLSGKTEDVLVVNNKIDNIVNGTAPVAVFVGASNTLGGFTNINNNSFTNVTYGVSSDGSAVFDATCNWYGSASGNTVETKIYGNANYEPWLVGAGNSASIGFVPTADCTGTWEVPTYTINNASCANNDGSITISWTGGTAPYTIAFDGGTATTETSPKTYSGLAAGSYNIVLTDANGTYVTSTQTVGSSPVTLTHGMTVTYHTTIQNAINAADMSGGDIIDVCAGTYNEEVTIDRPLTLRGAQYGVDPRPSIGSARVIDAATETVVTQPGNKNIFKITATGVTIDGFQFSHPATGSGIDAVRADGATGLTFVNNITVNSRDEGIQAVGGSDLMIKHNYFYKSNGDAVNVSGNIAGSNHKVLENDIYNSTSAYGAIYLYDINDVEVARNVVNTEGSIMAIGQGLDGLAAKNINVHHNNFSSLFRNMVAVVYGIAVDDVNSENISINNNVLVQNGTPSSEISFKHLIRVTANVNNIEIHENYLKRNDNTKKYVYVAPTVSNTVEATCNWYDTNDGNFVLGRFEGGGSINYLPFLNDGTDTDGAAVGFVPTAGACTGCPDGRLVTNTNTGINYCTIQSAIDDPLTLDTHVITVGPGVYPEIVTVNKVVDLRGPKYGTQGYDMSRGTGEAIVTPPASKSYAVFTVNRDGVSINGFTIDGDNPTVTTTDWEGTNGADIDAQTGIDIWAVDGNTPVYNVKIENNIIQNLTYTGIEFYGWGASGSRPAGSGNLFKDNLIKDLGIYGSPNGDDNKWGLGVLMYDNNYARVEDNVMTNVRTGIQTGNFFKANPGAADYQVFSGNTIQGRRSGIFHNLFYGAGSSFTLENNTITALAHAGETPVWNGILLSSQNGVVQHLNNNSIDGADVSGVAGMVSSGINVWHVNTTSPGDINGGTIQNVTNGVFVNNFEGYNQNSNLGGHATITGVTITGAETGVKVWDGNNAGSTHAKVSATIANSTITATSTGVMFASTDDHKASGSVTGSTITAGSNGIYVDNASATDGVSITNNAVSVTNREVASIPTMGIGLRNVAGSSAATVSSNTVSGAFYGYGAYNVNTTPVTTITGGTVTNVMQGLAILNTLDGGTNKAGSNLGINGVSMSGFTGSSTNPAINFHAGIYTYTTGGTTAAEGIDLAVSNVTIDGTGKPSQASGGIYLADFSGGTDMVQTVTVNGSNIINNANRGVDARGKVDLTLTANTLDNNGHDAFGTGGNYGYTIIAQQNSKVTAYNNFINLPASSTTRAYGLGLGNGSTNLISAHDNSILMNGNTDPDSRLAINPGTGTIDATCNWWGAGVCAVDVAYVEGTVMVYPYLVSGTDADGMTAGFQPQVGACSGVELAISGISPAQNPICADQVTTLTANGVVGEGATVTWFTGPNGTGANLGTGLTLSGAHTGITYYARVTGDCGPAKEASFALTEDGPVENINTGKKYCAIQSAIDDPLTLSGHTISVSAGTYYEQIVVDKSLTIVGPNEGIDPNTGVRGAEAILAFPSGYIPSSDEEAMVFITADNVTINGFTLDGQAYSPTGSDQSWGISSEADNTKVLNNRVLNFATGNVYVSSWKWNGTSWYTEYRNGAEVRNNYIASTNLLAGANNTSFLYGIYLQGTYGQVTNNVVEDVQVSIQVQPYQHPNNLGVTGLVSGNNFEGYRDVIWYNAGGLGISNPATSWNFTNNSLTGIARPAGVTLTEWKGFRTHSYKAGSVAFNTNAINKGTADSGTYWYIMNSEGAPTVQLDAECNWYGVTSGNTIEAGISGDVDYESWYSSGGSSTTIGFTPTGTCDATWVEIDAYSVNNASCANNDGWITYSWTGGTGDYTVALNGGTGISPASSPYTFNNLAAGTYVIKVTDINGTYTTESVTVGTSPVKNTNTGVTYTTIQGAINAAGSSHTILVCDGTYVENVTMNKSGLTVKSVNGAATTIISNPTPGSETPGVSAITGMGTLTLEGFTVDGFRGAIVQSMANAAGTTFIVKDNVVNPETNGGTGYMRNGIQVSGNGSQVLNNTVNGAPLTNAWSSTAIHAVNGSNILVSGNTVIGAADVGIGVTNWNAALVQDITITNNSVDGSGNSVRISGQGGQNKAVKNVIIRNNDMLNSANYSGLFIWEVALENLTVENNTITGHGFSGIEFWQPVNVSGTINVTNNNISGNGDYNIYNDSGYGVNADCNYWGSTDLQDILDTHYGILNFCGFLDSDTDTDSGANGFAPGGTCVPRGIYATMTDPGSGYLVQYGPGQNVYFNGFDGVPPYTFTYQVNGGSTQTVTSDPLTSTVGVAQGTNDAGTFTWTLLSVTDANGCVGTIDPMQNTVTIIVVASGDLPDLAPSISRPINTSFTPGQKKEGYVQVTNGGQGPTFGNTVFRISKISGPFVLTIDGAMTTSAGANVNNTDVTIDGSNAFYYTITYTDPIPVGVNIKIGYELEAVGSTGGNASMTTTIINGTGGDNNIYNNSAVRKFIVN